MSAYADTSFLVSLYGRDANSRSAISLFQQTHPKFVLTPFSEMEFTSIVFAITARPKTWTVREAQAIEEDFTHDLQLGLWQWEDLPPQLWTLARQLCRRHVPTLGCRALDALHVASAVSLAANEFYTFDRNQAKLAKAAGLRVLGC